jgi:nucleotide-binding universal stress UspA family protein
MRLLTLRTVLVATDLDNASVAAIETGRRLAAAAGAALHIVHVTHGSPSERDRGEVEAFVCRAGVEPDARHVHLVGGDPPHVIRLHADRIGADVIVVGPHRERRDMDGGTSLGSTALAIVTDSFAPCLVAREPLAIPIERVLVAVDLSDTARGALVVGLSWASALRAAPARASVSAAARPGAAATMLVLHVDRSTTGHDGSVPQSERSNAFERELLRIRDDAGQWAGVSIEDLLVSGNDTAQMIADAASEHRAGLIVLGTRGLGLDRVGRGRGGLGSVSASVVRLSATPVLLVPPAVWMSYASSEGHLMAR